MAAIIINYLIAGSKAEEEEFLRTPLYSYIYEEKSSFLEYVRSGSFRRAISGEDTVRIILFGTGILTPWAPSYLQYYQYIKYHLNISAEIIDFTNPIYRIVVPSSRISHVYSKEVGFCTKW
jgi:hypothetical protein